MNIVTTTKCFVLSTKRLVAAANILVAAAKILVAATKILFVVPNFVAVTKPFFTLASLLELYLGLYLLATNTSGTVAIGQGLWRHGPNAADSSFSIIRDHNGTLIRNALERSC